MRDVWVSRPWSLATGGGTCVIAMARCSCAEAGLDVLRRRLMLGSGELTSLSEVEAVVASVRDRARTRATAGEANGYIASRIAGLTAQLALKCGHHDAAKTRGAVAVERADFAVMKPRALLGTFSHDGDVGCCIITRHPPQCAAPPRGLVVEAVGVDCVDARRFVGVLQRHPNFAQRWFPDVAVTSRARALFSTAAPVGCGAGALGSSAELLALLWAVRECRVKLNGDNRAVDMRGVRVDLAAADEQARPALGGLGVVPELCLATAAGVHSEGAEELLVTQHASRPPLADSTAGSAAPPESSMGGLQDGSQRRGGRHGGRDEEQYFCVPPHRLGGVRASPVVGEDAMLRHDGAAGFLLVAAVRLRPSAS